MKRREKISEGLRLRGWGKFFHGLFLFITFPIRKPLIFVPILMLGYLAPTFMGAKPTEVHLWYWNKIKSQTKTIGSTISEKTQEIIPDVDNFAISMPSLKSMGISSAEKEQKIVDVPIPDMQKIRRQTFEKSKEAPNTVDALRTAQLQEEKLLQQENESVFNNKETQQDIKSSQASKLPLVYVEKNEEISGTAEVLNANELKINGKSYFLHGIYVNPKSQDGINAKNLLKAIIAQNIIHCQVKAYTYKGKGTLICFVNGENINWLLVNRGYSRNVALEK